MGNKVYEKKSLHHRRFEDFHLNNTNLDDAIEELTERRDNILKKIEDEGGKLIGSIGFSLDYEHEMYNSVSVFATVEYAYERLETEDEYNKRIKAHKKRTKTLRENREKMRKEQEEKDKKALTDAVRNNPAFVEHILAGLGHAKRSD